MDDVSRSNAELLDSMPTGVTIHVRGNVVYANPALLRMVGAGSLPEVYGRPIFDFIHPDYHELTQRRIRAVYDKAGPGDWVEILFRRLDGSSFDVEVAASAIDWEGQPASQVMITDITRRKQAERAQRETEDRYRRLLESLPIAVIVHSEGRTVYANRAATRAMGWTSNEGHLGGNVLDRIHPDDAPLAMERIRRVYGKEEVPEAAELRLVRGDGSVMPVEILSSTVNWAGRPASQVLITDLTERKRAEAERRALEQRIWQAQKMESLAVLAGGVAHDFNNLLTTILGNTDLARLELASGSPVRGCMDDIELAARRAADLARQMLAYAGKARVAIERIDLPALLRETAGLLGAAATRKAELRFRFDDAIPSVEGDATQIRQVAMNLLANAAEALGPSGGTITVAVFVPDGDREVLRAGCAGDELPSGRYVALEVTDTGSGMSDEVRARVFEPFFTTKRTGRGLGLAATLGIVRAHRGTIHVASCPGRGSTFRVLLPAAGDAVGTSRGSGRVGAPRRRTGGALLVVDDEDAVREVAVQILRREGFDVTAVANGAAAVALFGARPDAFDGVVVNVTMPHMDGCETLAALRRIRQDVPVVLCSGYGEEALVSLGADGVAPGFVAKPYTGQELLAAVRAALG